MSAAVRFLLLGALSLIMMATGLLTFVAVFFAFLGGSIVGMVVLGGLLFGYLYACSLTAKHIKAGESQPWNWIAIGLIAIALLSTLWLKNFR